MSSVKRLRAWFINQYEIRKPLSGIISLVDENDINKLDFLPNENGHGKGYALLMHPMFKIDE